ncbi:hypothetical protein HAX54_051186 [Datura stramonium]|uniref:Uncharacterized protein n=1 Tax=Datura stramonium TaxID=4076 RepID=A0ABS8WM34_DATST|nr:hypothetical protein [Datura stramonium]
MRRLASEASLSHRDNILISPCHGLFRRTAPVPDQGTKTCLRHNLSEAVLSASPTQTWSGTGAVLLKSPWQGETRFSNIPFVLVTLRRYHGEQIVFGPPPDYADRLDLFVCHEVNEPCVVALSLEYGPHVIESGVLLNSGGGVGEEFFTLTFGSAKSSSPNLNSSNPHVGVGQPSNLPTKPSNPIGQSFHPLIESSNSSGQPSNPPIEPQTDDDPNGEEYEVGSERDSSKNSLENAQRQPLNCHCLTSYTTTVAPSVFLISPSAQLRVLNRKGQISLRKLKEKPQLQLKRKIFISANF